jgi:cytosine/adenosine deaminase-related metal-dependent hydrolase
MPSKYHIKNGTIITIDPNRGVLKNCDVLISDHVITDVGPDLSSKATSEHIVIDATNAIISPGFVDTHRHTWQTQLRTVTSDHILTGYFLHIRCIYGSCYDPNDAYLGNYCGALESIDNGITFLIDHSHIMNSPDHADAAVRGLRDAKIRGVFCYGLYANPPWPGSVMDAERETKTPKWRFDDAKRVRTAHFNEEQAPTDLLRFGFAPAEIEREGIDDAAKEVAFGRSLGAAIVTGHIAQDQYDRGLHLVRNFEERGLLGPDLLFSHATSLAEDELEAVARRGVGLSSTPDTELQMGMGHPIAFKARDKGCTASLGCDVMCNNPGDMFQQMRLLLQTQRHKDHHELYGNGPPAKMSRSCSEILEIATLGGAKAVGLGDLIGSITPGKRADLLITRCDSTRMSPMGDPVSALVLYANASDIDTVFIDGEMVKHQGKLVGVDWPKVRAELHRSTEAIFERSKKAPFEAIEKQVQQIITAFATKL